MNLSISSMLLPSGPVIAMWKVPCRRSRYGAVRLDEISVSAGASAFMETTGRCPQDLSKAAARARSNDLRPRLSTLTACEVQQIARSQTGMSTYQVWC